MPSLSLIGVCVLLAAVNVDSQAVRYQRVGSSLTVTPDLSSVTPPISGLLWRHGPNKVLEWTSPEPTVDDYGQFKRRATLNITTAEMTISELTLGDSGRYSLEVDCHGGVISPAPLNLHVIAAVPKPTLSVSCDDDMTSCTLSCEGNTSSAGNITYDWSIDDTFGHAAAQVIITKEEEFSFYRMYRCMMKNQVSAEWSDTVCNPFLSWLDCTGARMGIALVVFISLFAMVLVIIFVHRWKAGVWFFNTGYMPWEADFWRNQEQRAEPDDAADEGVSVTTGNGPKYKFTRRKENDEANGSSAAEDRPPEGERLMTVNEGGASAL